jgi:hypothetical protein
MKLTSEKIDAIVLCVRVLTHSFQPKTRAAGETRYPKTPKTIKMNADDLLKPGSPKVCVEFMLGIYF